MIESRYQIFWRRFLAGTIDGLVFLPIMYLDPWHLSLRLPITFLVIWFIFHEIAWYLYSVIMHGRYGQTLGKMICKIRVIDKTEEKPITYRQAFFRDSILIVTGLVFSATMLSAVLDGKNPYEMHDAKDWIIMFVWSSVNLFWFLAELITMLTNKKRRAIHDFIAGSVVVKSS
jgi:uncharacterized RDD family membrane protein YckC